MNDRIGEIFRKVSHKGEYERTMRELEADGLVEVVDNRGGVPEYRATAKGQRFFEKQSASDEELRAGIADMSPKRKRAGDKDQ
jgi:DNA-binding PadR family transcriptional regulator